MSTSQNMSADMSSRAQSLPVDLKNLRALAAQGGMRLGRPVDEATFLAMRQKQGLGAPIKIAANTARSGGEGEARSGNKSEE